MIRPFTILLLLTSVLFSCSSAPAVRPHAAFEDATLAKDITKMNSTADPKDATDLFMSDDKQALLWVKLGDLAGEHLMRWEWYDPKGALYVSSGDYTVNKDGKQRPYSTAWHKIDIKDEKASTLPGKWLAKVYLDNKLEATRTFEIRKVSDFKEFLATQKVKPDHTKWAVVIGIEKYRKTSPVQFAENDTAMMRDYFKNRAGVPEDNIIYLVNENAGKSDIEVLVKDRLRGMVREGDTLYFYYAGHGIPADETPYLLPYDGDPESQAITAYAVETLYKDLDKIQAKNVFVFLDTCFSGRTGREEKDAIILAGVRPGVLKVKDPLLLSNKIVAITAAKSNQLSNFYNDQGHGLFTYYLLRGLIGEADANNDHTIQMKELGKYMEDEVGSTSRRLYGLNRQQNPVILPKPLADKEDLAVVRVSQ